MNDTFFCSAIALYNCCLHYDGKNSVRSWSGMDLALENLVHFKCANGTYIVCSICHAYHPNNVKGQQSAGVISMRKPFWNGYFRTHVKHSKTHRDSLWNKKHIKDAKKKGGLK